MADSPAAADLADDVPVTEPEEVVAQDVLVEEVSIDGMCGVY